MPKSRDETAWRNWERHYDELADRGAFQRDSTGKLHSKGIQNAEERTVANEIVSYNNPKRVAYGGGKSMPELLRQKLIDNGHVPDVPRRTGSANKVHRTREEWALAMREAGRQPVPKKISVLPAYWPVEVEGIGLVDIGPRLREIRAGRIQPSDSELMVMHQNGWDDFAPREGTAAHLRYQALKNNAPVALPMQGSSAAIGPPPPGHPSDPHLSDYPSPTATALVASMTYGHGYGAQPSSSSAPPPPWDQGPAQNQGRSRLGS
ncbi:hypothetical protein [Micromonospora yangpuensis]|uniref:Uncharacterized protein n=1 Tax=Micromonospora yangpuensis TaxID=683228 RepID=A0A1C6VBB5_9ACTN|nr:hypothetical protein [Micromonospora yangpuensis]GGM12309.1 hypothetical protein GCM10012279_33000 [Micromonospora yangpuensis]SCL63633.1 hypothetical protein GA0070617_5259 [Micromonospora yangpuensis]